MDTNRIELRRTVDGWMAYHFGPFSAEILDLFGTTVLPTAFTVKADAETVRREISKLNPGVTVK